MKRANIIDSLIRETLIFVFLRFLLFGLYCVLAEVYSFKIVLYGKYFIIFTREIILKLEIKRTRVMQNKRINGGIIDGSFSSL